MKIIRLDLTEDQLIKRCRKNERKAQYTLFQRMSAKMLGVCRRYTKSLEDAEEVLSNGFVKVFNKIHDFEDKGSFEGWVRRIMVNESINFIRYRKNLFVEMGENWQEPGHEEMSDHENAQEILELIDELPLGYRTVFNLYAMEGYPHKQIAEMLGITEGTSKSQLSKARRLLQDRIIDQRKMFKP